MFDIGWSELLVIGIVALIVVGPQDLPKLFHQLGRFTARARAMAREFSRAMEEAARESGVKEVTRDLRDVTSSRSLGLDEVEKSARELEAWNPETEEAEKARERTLAEEARMRAEAEARAAAQSGEAVAASGTSEPGAGEPVAVAKPGGSDKA